METLFVGKNNIFLPEIPSTNSYATHLLKNVNLAEGTLIHAASQTQGRGQRDQRWSSEPLCNLTVSFVMRPTFLELQKQFFLYLVAALAVHDTITGLISNSQFDIKIKWPNDILINRKKAAGILIENNLQNNRMNWSVIGIGLNVNQTVFPDHIEATSLKKTSGNSFHLGETLKLLCIHLEKRYLALKSKKYKQIRTDYLDRLFGLNSGIDFQIGEKVENLVVKGIGDTGLLMLQDQQQVIREVDVKQVKWLI